jgi:hypothetical protein
MSANTHQRPHPQLLIPLTQPPSSPPLSNPPPSPHLPEALLVLQHQLLITNKLLLAAANTAEHAANTHTTANTAAMSRKSSEFPRMALRLGAVGSGQQFDDSAWVPGRDGVGWDILRIMKVS